MFEVFKMYEDMEGLDDDDVDDYDKEFEAESNEIVDDILKNLIENSLETVQNETKDASDVLKDDNKTTNIHKSKRRKFKCDQCEKILRSNQTLKHHLNLYSRGRLPKRNAKQRGPYKDNKTYSPSHSRHLRAKFWKL